MRPLWYPSALRCAGSGSAPFREVRNRWLERRSAGLWEPIFVSAHGPGGGVEEVVSRTDEYRQRTDHADRLAKEARDVQAKRRGSRPPAARDGETSRAVRTVG